MTKAGAATTAVKKPAARMRQVSPASAIMERPVNTIRMAVPRSGCLATSRVGMPISTAGIKSFHENWASLADMPW